MNNLRAPFNPSSFFLSRPPQKAGKPEKAPLFKRALTALFLGFLIIGMSACGKNSANRFVQEVGLKTELVDNEVILDMSAIFNIGQLSMTAVQFSVVNPHDPTLEYGQFRVLPTLSRKTEIGARINLSDAASVPGGLATLPNGASLPVGGLDGTDILELRIPQMSARVYLALGEKALLMGFALPIKEFDQVAQYVGSVNIFPGFEFRGVRGMAGLFTGSQSGTSGIGFFLDLSSVISPEILNGILAGMPITQEEFNASKSLGGMESGLNFNKGIKVSNQKLEKTVKYLEKMKAKAKTLHYVNE